MKLKHLFIVLIGLSIASCTSEKKEKKTTKIKKTVTASISSKGYKLMEQKCFICHTAKPDPSKRGSMIAPPMAKVQEHYKPQYATKEAFTKAIVSWVKNPSKENTLMPGAIRKFNLMTKMPYDEADVKIIAETLFDMDFGKMPKMEEEKGLELNNGKKWKLKSATIDKVKAISKKLANFTSTDVKEYQQLGNDVFKNAKTIIMDDSYNDALFKELHKFFNNIEGNMHLLIAAQNIKNAKKQQDILTMKFEKFHQFFE